TGGLAPPVRAPSAGVPGRPHVAGPPGGATPPRAPHQGPSQARPAPSQQHPMAPYRAGAASGYPNQPGSGAARSPARRAADENGPRRSRHSRRTFWVASAGGVVVLVAVGVALWLWLGSAGDTHPPAGEKRIAQYDYSFGVPTGWHQTGGGGGQQRKVQIAPDKRDGKTSITVQEFRLTDRDRDRNVSELRGALADHGGFTGIDTNASFAGKQVVAYRQPMTRGTIDWYVLFRGDVQVSVGCEYGHGGAGRIRPTCERVVGSMSMNGN
ncbi:MAG: type VII secretion-associated protein, partial [Nocardioidaceae bacterium]